MVTNTGSLSALLAQSHVLVDLAACSNRCLPRDHDSLAVPQQQATANVSFKWQRDSHQNVNTQIVNRTIQLPLGSWETLPEPEKGHHQPTFGATFIGSKISGPAVLDVPHSTIIGVLKNALWTPTSGHSCHTFADDISAAPGNSGPFWFELTVPRTRITALRGPPLDVSTGTVGAGRAKEEDMLVYHSRPTRKQRLTIACIATCKIAR